MNKLKLALESIDFQSQEFADALLVYFDKIYEYDTAEKANLSAEKSEVVRFVKERTGLNIKLSLTKKTDNGLSIMPMYNENHIFIHPFFRGLAVSNEKAIKEFKEFKSTSFIDLKNAKVGGFFSEIKFEVLLNIDSFKKAKLTSKEALAIFMHELGHCFTSAEYIARTITTNQVLAAATFAFDEAARTNDNKKFVVAINELSKEVAGDENYFREIAEVTDKGLVISMIIGKTLPPVLSRNASATYDDTTCESQADVFAARFGLSRELVTGLAKHSKYSGGYFYEVSARIVILMQVFWLVSLIPLVGVLFTSGIGAGLGLSALKGVIFCLFSVYMSGDAYKDYTYDSMKVRFLRIKEQQISFLKNKDIKDDDKRIALASIKKIEEEINNVKEIKSVFEVISNFIFSTHRKVKSSIELQRKLEELAANDIYAKAAELSLLKA